MIDSGTRGLLVPREQHALDRGGGASPVEGVHPAVRRPPSICGWRSPVGSMLGGKRLLVACRRVPVHFRRAFARHDQVGLAASSAVLTEPWPVNDPRQGE